MKRRPRIALVLPTSLCSGQIAAGIAEKLKAKASALGIDRAVALPHTEGCGNSIGESERIFMQTMAGYVAHPFVTRALFLEHGCEKTHNDAFRNMLGELGLAEGDYAFRSVQLDGGIDRVTEKSIAWFCEEKGNGKGIEFFALAMHGRGIPGNVRAALGMVSAAFIGAGAAVVRTGGAGELLGYGERVERPGQVRMECPTDDDLEIITGLGATGAELILFYDPQSAVPGNPVVPTIRLGRGGEADLRLKESDSAEDIAAEIMELMRKVRSGETVVSSERLKDSGFQITRGKEGISL